MKAKNPILVSTLQELLAAPLTAVIEADFMAAREFARYIGEYGFQNPRNSAASTGAGANAGEEEGPSHSGERPPHGFIGDLRMISFRVDQTDADGKVRPRLVRLPALSLVPLPLLQVKEADFHFAVRVLEGQSEDKPGPVHLLSRPDHDEHDDPDEPEKVTWRAMLVPESAGGERDEPSTRDAIEANMTVQLAVAQSDIPAGITRLLSLMNESAQIVSGSIHLSRRRLELAKEQSETLKITVTSFKGEPVRCGVRAYFPLESGIVLEGNGHRWRAGGSVDTLEDGTITLRLSLDEASPVQRGEQIVVRFVAIVDGLEMSESLYIQVQ